MNLWAFVDQLAKINQVDENNRRSKNWKVVALKILSLTHKLSMKLNAHTKKLI